MILSIYKLVKIVWASGCPICHAICKISKVQELTSWTPYLMTEQLIDDSYNLFWEQVLSEVEFVFHGFSRLQVSTVHLPVHDLPASASPHSSQLARSLTSKAPTDSKSVKNGSLMSCPTSSSESFQHVITCQSFASGSQHVR